MVHAYWLKEEPINYYFSVEGFSQTDVDYGSPEGIRTPVAGMRTRYPRPLDDGTMSGWERRIRTSTNGSRTRRPTIRRSPINVQVIIRRYFTRSIEKSGKATPNGGSRDERCSRSKCSVVPATGTLRAGKIFSDELGYQR